MNYDDAKTSARPFMKPLSTCIALVAAVMFFGCKQNIGNESKTPAAQYKVTVEKTAGGNVTVIPALPESGMVDKETELTFTATKLGGYKFIKWERDGTDTGVTEPTYKLTVTQPVRIKAVFTVDETPITKTDQEKVEKAKEALKLYFQNGDTADNISSTRLFLPMNGLHNTKISWQSSDEAIIEIKKENERSYGSITRPEENTQVTLTATITKGDVSATKSFTVTVRGTNEDAVISAAEQAVRAIPSFMTKDTSPIQLSPKETVSIRKSDNSSVEVEVTINWDANLAGVISVSDGTVTPHKTEIKKVTLTATAKKGNAQTQKTVTVTVYPKNNEPDLQTVVENIINTIPAEIDADIQLPQAPSGYKLTWSSSNDSILKIEENSGYIV